MRASTLALAFALAIAALPAFAHGPQIQLTRDANGEIITHRIMNSLPSGEYPHELAPQTSVYVMPLTDRADGAWRATPNNSQLSNGDPEFLGWPGFMYAHGYDAITNPQPFPTGSRFILSFTQGLKSWGGVSSFVDAGATELEAYRGPSNAPTALAKTSDTLPFQSLMFPGAAGISFAADGADTHNTVHYRMLGNGTSIASPLADGVYLLSLQLSSTASSTVTPSNPFYFVLHKGAEPAALAAAVSSLGFETSAVQVIPEPGNCVLLLAAALCTGSQRRRRNQR